MSGIYCQLGDYMLPTTYWGNQKQLLTRSKALFKGSLTITIPWFPWWKKGFVQYPIFYFSGTLHEHLWTASWWLNQPIWKILVKIGSFPQGWKLKNIWNHHLAGESCTYPPSTMKHIGFQTFRPPTFRKQLPNLNLRDSSASRKRCQREQQL